MRASRGARDTASVVGALSAPKATRPRRSLRTTSRFFIPENDVHGDNLPGGENAGRTEAISLGKRKRKRETAETTTKSEARSPINSPPEQTVTTNDAAPTPPSKPRHQPAKHIKGPNGSILTTTPPTNWEDLYNATAQMRKRILAPVDTMGCESLAETQRSPRDQRLQTLIALMLSSQTKDTVTAAAMKNMQENMPGGLCLESLLEIAEVELNRLIEKVGFHNNKAKYIKRVAVILRDEYRGDIPDTFEGLVGLPGVGPKMAHLTLSAAWNRTEGIGVDVHVHRITNLWRWHKTSTPEQTRAELEAWLPREKWHEINHLLVGLGQTICLPVGRKCGECDLAEMGLCPAAVVGKKKSPLKRVKKMEVEIKEEEGVEDVKKKEEVVVSADDVGVKLEADLEDAGQIEAHTIINRNRHTA